MGQAEAAGPMNQAGISITLIGNGFADDAMRQCYIDVTGEHAEYWRQAEPGTLI